MTDAPPLSRPDPRLAAVQARDAGADGAFVYAVVTTGVYCRPSCPSRPARPENLRFFGTAQEARAAGFRPCLRCQPDAISRQEANAALVAEACRLIAAADSPPGLTDLAAQIGLSPAYFHRLFRSVTGLTPKAWAAALKAGRLRASLAGPGGSVTSAIYEAGYGSDSRVYEKTGEILGMDPSRYARGGAGEEISFAVAETSLGALLVARSSKGICAISLGEDPQALVHELEDLFPNARLRGDDPGFASQVAQVTAFVEAPQIGLDLPLDLRGTAFQQRVWQALRQIAPGETVSYAGLAKRLGAPKAVRAVAGACAANKLAIAVPCHRVVRSDGGLSGYRWGVGRKRALLEREASGG